MKFVLSILLLFICFCGFSQDSSGVLTGLVVDEKLKPLSGATVELLSLQDSLGHQRMQTTTDGAFYFDRIRNGFYRLKLSYVSLRSRTIDSIQFRSDRNDFNLNELILKAKSDSLEEVIIYAEKPLIESKDGNITFNAGESALSAGSNANELLTSVPLIAKDPDGKITVRGKEPKILIDDKPVELNQQQLQELLESMPGSAIEKIEVMTNPPPQYANEEGGVINIVTKKGRVGKTARINVSGGTRGQGSVSGHFSYKKNALSLNINGGLSYNEFDGEGGSVRENYFNDSTNFFFTGNESENKALRPNFRGSFDYDVNKNNLLNATLTYNSGQSDNENTTEYKRVNTLNEIYRLSQRTLASNGENMNANTGLNYTHKTKRPGETIKIFTSMNFSRNKNERMFLEEFLNPDYTPTLKDSTQRQFNENETYSTNARISYDLPLKNRKTFISAGSFYNYSHSEVTADGLLYNRASDTWNPIEILANEITFRQKIANLRASVKQIIAKDFSTTAGMSAERTNIEFYDSPKSNDTLNNYWSFLPFLTVNKKWSDILSLTLSYRKSIRRPGLGELNPSVDIPDPFTIRIGNPNLDASLSHNFDFVLGRTQKGYYVNLGLGYNSVQEIFSLLRDTMVVAWINNGLPREYVSWMNLGDRQEYEVSTWNGYTISKKVKVNLSASYRYSKYDEALKVKRKFRDGGTFTSSLNGNYNINDRYSTTGSFTFNRFANPQGQSRSTLSMNIGMQAKLLEKRLTLTLNVIDPLKQQQNKSYTTGKNFNIENFNVTRTRNVRFTVGYNLVKTGGQKLKGNPAAKQDKEQKKNN